MITPQSQIVYIKWYQTVCSSKDHIPKFWGKPIELYREIFIIDLYDELKLEQDK